MECSSVVAILFLGVRGRSAWLERQVRVLGALLCRGGGKGGESIRPYVEVSSLRGHSAKPFHSHSLCLPWNTTGCQRQPRRFQLHHGAEGVHDGDVVRRLAG